MKSLSCMRLAATLCLAAGSYSAQAQLQLTCSLDWSALAGIDGPHPDKVIFGVKARDWTKDLVDQMMAKEEECFQTSTDPESLKKARLAEIRSSLYPMALAALEARDQRQRQLQQQQQQQAEALAQEAQARAQREQDLARAAANDSRPPVGQAPAAPQESAISAREAEQRRIAEEYRQQGLRNAEIDAERRAAHDRSEKLWMGLAVVALAVGGWAWNKFVRNRCPHCQSTRYDTLEVTEVDRWRGTKTVTEKHSRGTNTRHVQTTYVQMLFQYRCKDCRHEWEKQRKEELGSEGTLGRFLSGY